MGDLPASHSRRLLVPPDSPPELASPGASSSPATEPAWEPRAPGSLLLSGYYKSPAVMSAAAGKSPDCLGSSGRPASRQQLPSLSSLFRPSSLMQSLRRPSDRDAAHLSCSPPDWPRASHGMGSSSSLCSYYPPTASPPLFQPRSTYDVQFDPERQSLPAFARAFSGPISPGYRDQMHARPDTRHDADAGSSKWSAYRDSGRHEYSLGARDSSFRSPGDRARSQLPGSRDLGPEYPDHKATHGGSHPQPQPPPPKQPAGSAMSEGMPSKDGLGPKIWTGTHFLPRFVRTVEVPGEGMCYFYDDGSHCKTVIDDEAVKADWGVTKAGKPRKRLATACVTCREKRIKCDPHYPRCLQCEKIGLVCKFKNTPRGGHNTSASTAPAEVDDLRKVGVLTRHGDTWISESGSSPPVSPRASLRRQSSPDSGYRKRLKVGPESYVANSEPSSAPPWRRSPMDSMPCGLNPTREVWEPPGAKSSRSRNWLLGTGTKRRSWDCMEQRLAVESRDGGSMEQKMAR